MHRLTAKEALTPRSLPSPAKSDRRRRRETRRSTSILPGDGGPARVRSIEVAYIPPLIDMRALVQ